MPIAPRICGSDETMLQRFSVEFATKRDRVVKRVEEETQDERWPMVAKGCCFGYSWMSNQLGAAGFDGFSRNLMPFDEEGSFIKLLLLSPVEASRDTFLLNSIFILFLWNNCCMQCFRDVVPVDSKATYVVRRQGIRIQAMARNIWPART